MERNAHLAPPRYQIQNLKQNVIILFKNAIKDGAGAGTKAPADYNPYAAYTVVYIAIELQALEHKVGLDSYNYLCV